MVAKIGILGEDTAVAQTTVTVYTVPADKAARVRVLFCVEAPAGAVGYGMHIGTPGTESYIGDEAASGADFWTGISNAAGNQVVSAIAIQDEALNDTLIGTGGSKGSIFPLPIDYFLSTGDTVRYKINGNDAQDHISQVIGVEDDA